MRERGSLEKAQGLGSEESREQMRKREKRREIMREEREISRLKRRRESIKNYYFVLELSYNAILQVELHCSTIANFFAIVEF